MLESESNNDSQEDETEDARIYIPHAETDADTSEPSAVANWLNRIVDSLVYQLLFLLLAVLHCIVYFFDWSEEDIDQDGVGKLLTWTLVTGGPLVGMTIAEYLIRVRAQAGPLLRLSSWKDFFLPFFHRVELVALGCYFYRIGFSSYNLLVYIFDAKYDAEVQAADRLTVVVVFFYCMLRIWGSQILHVNVQRAKTRRANQFELKEKVWMVDQEEEVAKHEKRIKVRLEHLVDTMPVQVVLFLSVFVHLWFYTAPRTWPDNLGKYYDVSRVTGYALVAIFSTELVIRITSQGGEKFFVPRLHKTQFCVLTLGLFLVGYATWWHQSIRDREGTRFEPAGSGTAILFLTDRILRFIGIFYKVSGGEWYSDSVTASVAQRNFMARFADVLEVPPQNIVINPSQIRIQKAKLKPKAFESLHLPLSIYDGLLEELVIKIPGPLNDNPFVFSLRNLLLLVGPGPGLADAGGLDAGHKYWQYESVLEAKANLCDLISTRLTPNKQKGKQPAQKKTTEGEAPVNSALGAKEGNNKNKTQSFMSRYVISAGTLFLTVRLRAIQAFEAVKKKVRDVAVSSFSNAQINIRNITIQFEDHSASLLKHTPMVAGFRIGDISAWTYGSTELGSIRINILRVGAYMQADHARTQHSQARPRLRLLMEEHPQKVIQELVKLDGIECFRCWALYELEKKKSLTDGQQHSLYDRLRPENPFLFSLLRLSLVAGSEEGLNTLRSLEDIEKEKEVHAGPRVSVRNRLRKLGSRISSMSGAGQDKDEDPTLWRWRASLTPIRFAIDNEQVQSLHTLIDCMKSWGLLDVAFRWRPNLTYASVEAREEDETLNSANGGSLTRSDDRSSLARQWWIYAIHRVLAQLRMKPNIPWLSAMWRAANVSCYRDVLQDLANAKDCRRSGRLGCLRSVGGGSARRAGIEWEERLQKELQVRLPLGDIVATYKGRSVVQEERQDDEGVDETEERKGPLQRLAHSVTATFRVKNINKEISDRSLDQASAVSSPGSSVARMHSPESLAVSRLQSPASIGSRSKASSHSYGTRSTHRPIVTSITKIIGADDEEEDEGGVSWETAVGAKLNKIAGSWQIDIARIEFRILTGGSLVRPVLIHMKFDHVLADAKIRTTVTEFEEKTCALGHTEAALSTAAPKRSLFAFTVTVQHFSVNCPQAGRLLLGGGTYMCSVMSPLLLPVPPLNSNMIAGRNSDSPQHLAFRVAATPGGAGLFEIHIASMRAVLNEPLFLTLLRDFSRPPYRRLEHGDMFSVPVQASHHSSKLLVATDLDFNPVLGHVSVKNGRAMPWGVMKVRHVHTYTKAGDNSSNRAKDHAHKVQAVRRKLQRLNKIRRKFEMISGIAGDVTAGWKLSFHVGALHGVQIGHGIVESMVVLDEYRSQPFVSACFASKMSRGHAQKLVSMETDQFRDSCLPDWSDHIWKEIYALVKRRGRILPWAPLHQVRQPTADSGANWSIDLEGASCCNSMMSQGCQHSVFNSPLCCIEPGASGNPLIDQVDVQEIAPLLSEDHVTPVTRVTARAESYPCIPPRQSYAVDGGLGKTPSPQQQASPHHIKALIGEGEDDDSRLDANDIDANTVRFERQAIDRHGEDETVSHASCEVLVRALPREIVVERGWLIQESWRWLRSMSSTEVCI